ncbi:MAG: hypothetical protein U0804_19340 [Gemmataceae bacterium]
MIRFKCQSCGEPLTSPDSTAGETGRCPHCREIFDIPSPRGAAKPGVLRLVCPGCDKTLGVPATAAGKPCVCPACSLKFLVPADAEPEEPAPRSRRDRDDDEDDRPARRRPRDDDDEDRRPARRRSRDDDEDDEPVSRSRRPRDDDDDDDRPSRRSKPKPKKRRKSRGGGGGLPDWYRGPLGRLAENAVITVLLGLLALAVPGLGGGLLTAWGFVLMMGGSIWFLVLSAKEGVDQLLLNLFIPFYSLYYAISRWDDVKHPVTLYLIGVVQYLIGAFVFLLPLLAMAQRQQQMR